MALFRGLRAKRLAKSLCIPGMVAGAAITLTACNNGSQPNIAAVQTHGASVAFASIDGLPQGQFQTLVQDLNKEAQTRRLAVASREQPSAYRVRGYLAAVVDRGKTTISWVWDVFDRNKQRALRISGSEVAKGGQGAGRGWQAADNAMLQRIAHASMGELAAFLTSPTVAPAAAPAASGPRIAFTTPDITTPESAGIFRIFHPKADPVSTPEPATTAAITAAAAVPLPRRRPPPATALSRGETMTLAAARR
jgi:hypothetical protein